MSADKLKNYVDRNRDRFEVYEEDFDGLWGNIESTLERRRPFKSWMVAAGLALIVMSSALLWRSQAGEQLPIEITEAEIHYAPRITSKMQLIQNYHNEVDDLIWQDLQLLEEAFLQLKLDLKEEANNGEVVQAIIENYRNRLDVLDRVLHEIEEKEYEKEEEPKFDA